MKTFKDVLKKVIYYISLVLITIFIYIFLRYAILPHFGYKAYWYINLNQNWGNTEAFDKNSAYIYLKDNGSPLVIQLEKGTKTKALTEIINIFDSTPPQLLKDCVIARISYEPVSQMVGVAIEEDKKENIYGYAGNEAIFLNDNYIDQDIVFHELSHIYNNHHDSLSDKEDFKKLNELDSFHSLLFKSELTAQNLNESWAILSSVYWRYPDETKDISPEVYDYFNNIYKT